MSQTVATTPSPSSAPEADEAAARRLPRGRALLRSDRFWGWAGPLLVALVGGIPRFWDLGRPHKLIFDEVYYVKEALSYLNVGYELTVTPVKDGAADPFTLGHTDIFGSDPDRVVHPPVGKWMIAFGEWLFGPQSSFGWRFSSAVVGTLALVMIGRIGRRLFRSTLLGTTAALLLAVDGQEFVHSRVGILDIFVMFWALAAFGCLLIDRDRVRERLARCLPPDGVAGPGPWLGPRWWRIAGIICLGLCTGVKWSGIYFSVAFLAMSLLWDFSARRAAGVRHWVHGALLKDGAQAAITTVVLLPATYLATWTGWFVTSNGWNRRWGAEHPAQPGWGWVPDALRSLWHYHAETWQFHTSLTSPHDWQANPWAWLVLGRPTLYLFDQIPTGQAGCHAASCHQMITALGNPLIWWTATIGVGVLLFQWLLARDWRAGAVLWGIIGGYLPWFLYQYRTIFEFYAVAFAPWVVLTVTYCLGLVLGPPGAPADRRRVGAYAAGGYVLTAVLFFWFFYPVLSGQTLPQTSIDLRDWLPSWY